MANTIRTRVLQVRNPQGWEFIFCWSVNTSRVVTTSTHKNAIPDRGDNLEYFRMRAGGREVRSVCPSELNAVAA
jgi:hypothetical protein